MSELLKNIQAKRLKHVYAFDPMKMVSVETLVTEIPTLDQYEYRVEVRIGQSITCPPEQLSRAIGLTRQRISHAIYGDFRDKLLELARASMAYPGSEVEKLITELLAMTNEDYSE